MPYRQLPLIVSNPQLGPRRFFDKAAGFGGFAFGVKFCLAAPATSDGFIIQKIVWKEEVLDASGVYKPKDLTYFEVWPVSKGQFSITDSSGKQTLRGFCQAMGLPVLAPTPGQDWELDINYNDWFFRLFPDGSFGSGAINALVGFYDDPLPASFVSGNKNTFAGSLRARNTQPSFWEEKGLVRNFKFKFDFKDPATVTSGIESTVNYM